MQGWTAGRWGSSSPDLDLPTLQVRANEEGTPPGGGQKKKKAQIGRKFQA